MQLSLRKTRPVFALPALLAGTLVLAACGGSDSSNTDSGNGSGSGSLTLGITDAPVDNATEVNVVFTGITLQPRDGERLTFTCDEPAADPAFDCAGEGSRTIDMLELTGDASETLLDGIEVAGGRYDWVRLNVDAGTPAQPDSGASSIVLETAPDSPEPLLIPSGSQSGLKLVSGFDVPVNGEADFTIDLDLRKALTRSSAGGQTGSYMLRPALRLVDNSSAGHLEGEITNEFVQTTCTNGDTDPELAVYVYEGADAATGDIGDADSEPVTTAATEPVDPGADDSNHDYRIGFLAAGDYTVAVTCDAGDDDPEADDELAFAVSENVTVAAGAEPTVQNFE